MRNLLPKLLVLAATSLPVAAHADTIDDFVLTGPIGDTITFSLPASPPIFGPSSPFLFETFPVLLSFNPPYFGSKNLDGQILFYSALGGGGLNVMIYHPGGTTPILDHGDLLYSGTTTAPTFLTGTFNVGSDTVTITPQTGPVPEPSTLTLLGTGIIAVLCLARTLSPQTARYQS
jgi:PEP-CTERM motif